jgi:hypothetical protein
MSRWLIRSVSTAALAVGMTAGVATAQSAIPNAIPAPTAENPALAFHAAEQAAPVPAAAPAAVNQQYGYVRLNAPMYPAPKPNIPIWTGSTMITNQALAPHEMLYPHTYRAMYPPFYHRVKGHYFWTPLGMRTHEKWQLQGTMVQVKYRSQIPKLFGPHRPVISYWGGPWK